MNEAITQANVEAFLIAYQEGRAPAGDCKLIMDRLTDKSDLQRRIDNAELLFRKIEEMYVWLANHAPSDIYILDDSFASQKRKRMNVSSRSNGKQYTAERFIESDVIGYSHTMQVLEMWKALKEETDRPVS